MKSEATAAAFDEDFDELEDFDDAEEREEERGLSGLVVLLMGVVMLGALASVVWIAYKQGVRSGETRETPYVSADPAEPLKIENTVADAGDKADLQVYDRLGGEQSEPVAVIAEGPEEPVDRNPADPIAAAAAAAGQPTGIADDAVADRIAELAKADETLATKPAAAPPSSAAAPTAPAPKPEAKPATPPTTASATTQKPTVSYRTGGALAGTHLVQIGAFRSEAEADGQWTKLEGKLGDYAEGKSTDVERADLGQKGVYYRLRIGPFASASEAKTYCVGLKDRGTDCLIKAK